VRNPTWWGKGGGRVDWATLPLARLAPTSINGTRTGASVGSQVLNHPSATSSYASYAATTPSEVGVGSRSFKLGLLQSQVASG